MTLELEIGSPTDLKLFISLAQRLKIKTTLFDDSAETICETTPAGEPLDWLQVADRLQNAENQTGISLALFEKKLALWK